MGPSMERVLGRWASRSLSALGMLVSVLMTPGLAAETITLSFPPLPDIVLDVKDLETFAKTGEQSPKLSQLTRLIPNGNSAQLQAALGERMVLSPKTVQQAVNSPLGSALFERVGKVLLTDKGENGGNALKKALTTAAQSPDGVSMLSVIQAFPSTTIKVEGQVGMRALQAYIRVTENQNRVVAFLSTLAKSENSPAIPANLPNPAQKGPYTWTKKSIPFTNPNRDSQPIPAELYLPQGLTQPMPLIVISHGLASDRFTFNYLAEHFASQGFPVASITHPGSDSQRFKFFLSGTEIDYRIIPGDLVNRPLDIKYFLNTLEKTAAPDWQINIKQVGVFGHSMGGYTALAVAGAGIDRPATQQECNRIREDLNSFNISALLQCRILGMTTIPSPLQDERVKAVVAVNPIGSVIFGQAGMAQIKIPTMIIAGSEDIFAPPLEEQFIPFTWLTTPDKYLALVTPATHFSVLGESESGIFPVPDDLIGPNPSLARPIMQGISSAFFQTYVIPNPEFQGFLGQKQASQFAKSPFALYMIRELTQAQINNAIAAGPSGR